MHITIHTLMKQRGAATLVVSLILLLAITLMTFSGVRVGVSEQRISANDLRAKQAMTVAEGLVENGIALLEANKTFINNSVVAAGWLYSAGGVAARWQACGNTTVAVPCGNGTANVYNNTWLFYTPPAAQLMAVSGTIYPAAYTEGLSFVTPNLGTVAAPIVADYPRIDVIANVTPGADTFAGSAQAKQIVQSVKLLTNIPKNAIVAATSVPLTGNLMIWGNPTGLQPTVISAVDVAAGAAPAADYIVYYNNEPTAKAGAAWGGTFGNVNDENLNTVISTATANATTDLTISNNAAYTAPIGSVTIGLRAKVLAGTGSLDWGLLIGGAPYYDTVTGTASTPVALTTAWGDYFKTWILNPATNTPWTVAAIGALQARIKNSSAAGTTTQVAEVWVDGYRVRYTVSVADKRQTAVEKGFPLSITTQGTATLSGSITTCQNWASTVRPSPGTIPPYSQWYPGGNSPSCSTLSRASYVDEDVRSLDTSVPPDIFNYIFGKPHAQYQEIKNIAVVLANCDSINANSKGLFWITGGCDLPSAGTAADPVTLIVEGNFSGNSNRIFTGLIYLFTPPGGTAGTVQVNGNAVIIGALVSDHNVDGNGSLALVYSRSVLQNTGGSFGSFAKVPGAWTDQL